jgi:hypothetical protein
MKASRAGCVGDMDMRHPSTPGDRETVRAAAPAGQIPRDPQCSQATSAPRQPTREVDQAPYPRGGGRADVPEPVDSALPVPAERRYVRASSSFPAFASALPRSCVGAVGSQPSKAV